MTSATDLAAALRGGPLPPAADLMDQALYHGIGPLLLARSGADVLRPQARARAMWELRHRMVLVALLAALKAAGVRAIVMKGTALAYDLYPDAALRSRGDTDLLIAPQDIDSARKVLRGQGFSAFFDRDAPPGAGRSQEPWSFAAPDGSSHDIDLHWQPLNGAALAGVIPADEALAEAVPLPRLALDALALSRPSGLLHASLHRAQHIVSPYFIGARAHYGGDRLIWLCDIDLLCRALTGAEWQLLLERAVSREAAGVCLAALEEAQRLFGTPVPAEVLARLAAAPPGKVSAYLLRQGRIGRLFADLRALGPRRALIQGRYRLFPPAEFLRMCYPGSRQPVPLLWARRLGGFLSGRRKS